MQNRSWRGQFQVQIYAMTLGRNRTRTSGMSMRDIDDNERRRRYERWKRLGLRREKCNYSSRAQCRIENSNVPCQGCRGNLGVCLNSFLGNKQPRRHPKYDGHFCAHFDMGSACLPEK
ncbi:Protein of unknown function [Pyronema omphalodes CBS 100304]|uniref:Uncharacterized protein n=1 Tax=Pyronema omphalodes (strain CBS 100304) TaxID=1076935 RepID=U4KZA6_PYROM|nr:Protein of unknown function [Pyronema omphalodes CBS 100304]